MRDSGLRTWVRKLGPIGLALCVLLVILRLSLEAIFEAEIQSLWRSAVKPCLLSVLGINIDIPIWALVLAVMAVALAVLAVAWAVRRGRTDSRQEPDTHSPGNKEGVHQKANRISSCGTMLGVDARNGATPPPNSVRQEAKIVEGRMIGWSSGGPVKDHPMDQDDRNAVR